MDAQRRTGDRVIVELAMRQHGVVARSQLIRLGYLRGAIEHRLRTGRLHPIHRGVYAVGRPGVSPRGHQLAAVLACGPGAVLSHASAASVWNIASTPRGPPEVTVERRLHRRPGICIHYALGSLNSADRTVRDAIPVTGLPRTLLDLARLPDMRTLEHAIERAERRGLFDLAELQALLRRNRGSPGSGSLRAALDAYVEPAFTRSELERTFVELVRKAGLPTPSVNAVVAGYEVDILWRAERFGVELDTYEFHGTRAAFERDRRRHEDLKFQGIEIVRVTGQRIDRERELVVRRIGELLNRRRRETSGDG